MNRTSSYNIIHAKVDGVYMGKKNKKAAERDLHCRIDLYYSWYLELTPNHNLTHAMLYPSYVAEDVSDGERREN